MKLLAKHKYVYTFEHYELKEGTSDAQAEYYEYKETLPATFVSGRTVTYMFVDRQLPAKDMVMSAKDKEGRVIFIGREGAIQKMYINDSSPVFDVFGNLVHYRHTLRPTLPYEPGTISHG